MPKTARLRHRAPDIADRVSAAWYRSHGTERIEIAVGTVAALTVNPHKPSRPADLIEWFRQVDDASVLARLHEIWGRTWIVQPYLVQVARPLHSWLDENLSSETVRAVRAIIETALDAGLLDITNDTDPAHRASEDVLGAVLTHMRSTGARKGLGEFHTPADVAEIMARLVNTELPDPGQAIHEPTAGSGGLIRAAAQNIRRLGGDPAQYTWAMGDIDSLAIACAATNAIVWGLGDNVLAYRADALAEPGATQRAIETRQAVLDHHRAILRAALPIATLERTLRDLEQAPHPHTSEDAA